jgi:hypothetical protein
MESVPRPSASVVPGTGAVLAEDLGRSPNPCRPWGAISDPYLEGDCDSRAVGDPYIVRRTGDGDPHVAIGQSAPSSHYRRYISRYGEQSIYDLGVKLYPNPGSHTRTQTQKWSTSQNPMSFGPGHYVFYLSFRLQELANGESVHPNELVAGGGIARFTQLFQIKSFGGPGGNVGTFGSSIGANGIRFKADDQNHNNSVRYLYGLEPGEWYRIAVVAEWDEDGWYEVWADLDQNGSMVRVLDRQYGRDFTADQPSSAWGIGHYHWMSLFDGSVEGQPRRDMVYTDYANAQITSWSQP